MTQPSLPGIPAPPTPSLLRIELEDLSLLELTDGVLLTVRAGERGDCPTIAAHRFVGVQQDLVHTIVGDLVHDWCWAPNPVGVLIRRVQQGARHAQRHARDYARR